MMTDDVVIRAEGLGKRYAIGHEAERERYRYVALRDVLARGAHNLWRKTADMARGRAIVAGDSVEEFWALKEFDKLFDFENAARFSIRGVNRRDMGEYYGPGYVRPKLTWWTEVIDKLPAQESVDVA
jgi:hypothetical protein